MSDRNQQTMPEFPYSYHTFLFPFLWNNGGRVTRKQFEKCIHPHWVPEERADVPFDTSHYAQYAYFNQAARNTIFTEAGEKNPIVKNYRFDIGRLSGDADWLGSRKGKDNPARYVIRKDGFTASLRVNGIRLRLFSTGVGMIVFELENYEHNDEKAINRINEYGRRIFVPFVGADGSCKLCADDITLEYPGGAVVSAISGVLPKTNSDIRFMELISYLLRNEKYAAVTGLKAEKNRFHIEPIIDDRMFVSCVWCNNDFNMEMKQYTDGDYRYLSDAITREPNDSGSAARRLYELLFVDGDGLSCRSRTMLRQMLEEHVYDRWLEYSAEYGTLIGISEFSMVTVSGDPISVNAHLTEYTEMIMLVLAQRASLLSFEWQISDCAKGRLRIDRIQREYIHFQSKYLLREITPQQQGIELYNMLCRHMFIGNMAEEVEKQISALFALKRNDTDNSNNILFSILSILSVVELANYLTSSPDTGSLLLSSGLVAVLLVWFLLNHRNRIK